MALNSHSIIDRNDFIMKRASAIHGFDFLFGNWSIVLTNSKISTRGFFFSLYLTSLSEGYT